MATVPFYFGVPFGAPNTGRAATMQYQIVDNGGTGTTRQAFTGTGVTEDASDPGYYLTPAVNVDSAWVYPLKINWQDTGVATLRGTELFNKGPVLEALALPAAVAGASGGIAILGETLELLDANDLAAIVTAVLTAAISPTSRPTIGTVAEALAAARAAAIGNKTANTGTGAIVLKASDDTTTFSTLTLTPSIAAPTAEVRS